MKTKELIKLLQEEDPNGELDVVIGNAPVILVEKLPAFYDGKLERFDDAVPFPTKARYVNDGHKISLRSYSIEDALWDNPDLEVVCPSEYYENYIEKIRQEVIDCINKIEEEKKNQL